MESIEQLELTPNQEVTGEDYNKVHRYLDGHRLDFRMIVEDSACFINGYDVGNGIVAYLDDTELKYMYFENKTQFINHINKMIRMINSAETEWVVETDKIGIEQKLNV